MVSYLSKPGEKFDYDFTLLSVAVSVVYTYGLAIPVGLWLALRYLGVGEWSVVEAIAVWGYGQFVWIPVSVSHHLSFHTCTHTVIRFSASHRFR